MIVRSLLLAGLLTTFLFVYGVAQPINYPAKPASAGELLQQLKKLNVVGSVLYVAAHPDDENTLLLAYLANERHLQTAYLSLTRGDGGQNLIGPEQGVEIGLIRTQELLAARRVDGPAQLFSRAYDFGFSKSTEEAVRTWGREQVLADVVWAIRRHRPDVIITRFPPDARAGHGHHSASGYLAEEAFTLSGDATKYPEQLRYPERRPVQPWRARRIFWNVFIPGQFLSTRKPDEKGNLIGLETGLYNPLLGRSYGEVAAESRSQHKSQGFGVPANRGARVDYLLLKGGDPVQADPFEGIDLTWNRVPGSQRVQELVNQAVTTFNPAQPAATVPTLVALYRALQQLDSTNHYVATKKQDVQRLMQQCLGLFLEANPTDYAGTPGERIDLRVSAVNRSSVPVTLLSVRLPQLNRDSTLNAPLRTNDPTTLSFVTQLPRSLRPSQPYWLEKPVSRGLFQVEDQQLIGLPENPPALTADWTVDIEGLRLTFSEPWRYKSTDPVDGELYRPFEIRPAVTANITEKVYAFTTSAPATKTVDVLLKANRANVVGSLRLDVPPGWRVTPASRPFSLPDKYQEQRLSFTVAPGEASPGGPAPTNGKLRAVVTVTGATTSGNAPTTSLRTIAYRHIPPQTWFPAAEAVLERLDVRVTARRIGYIAGAGDEVPAALRQIGCQVTMLGEAELNRDLSGYQAIVVGIRAYNTEDRLRFYQEKLMDYVRNGGTMVVQYVTPGGSFIQNGLKVAQIGPYPFSVGRDRVTEEDSPVTFLNPAHPLLNHPNTLTPDDFRGWVQERGIYFAVDWDKAYEPLLALNDTNEAPKQGSLIAARFGKGLYVYTGLAFFRQLPAGVPGAYRLFANLISGGK